MKTWNGLMFFKIPTTVYLLLWDVNIALEDLFGIKASTLVNDPDQSYWSQSQATNNESRHTRFDQNRSWCQHFIYKRRCMLPMTRLNGWRMTQLSVMDSEVNTLMLDRRSKTSDPYTGVWLRNTARIMLLTNHHKVDLIPAQAFNIEREEVPFFEESLFIPG